MMNDPADRRQLPGAAGLCAGCRHARAVVSARGSHFLRCQRSSTEPAYPRYPRLPVTACAGVERVTLLPPGDDPEVG